jgi:NAD(P)-dependent dehydrogenase (short-subunit alcohol dehydrogenase family)
MSEAVPDVRKVPVALVTGASRRVGREIALALARDGHDIAIHTHHLDHDAEVASEMVRGLGRRCQVFEADFSDEAATAALLPAVLKAFGRIDSVVHNASLFVYDDVQTLSYANLTVHTCTNTGSAVLLARALHAHLLARNARGSLVLLLDQRLWNPNPDYLSYTLSKSALEMLTRLLAKALAPALRVVGVAPGLTLGSSLIDDERLARMSALSLTGNTTTTAQIAEAVSFAVRNEALTGSTLMVDAGYHLQPMARDFPFL